jgi:hypothetical protein
VSNSVGFFFYLSPDLLETNNAKLGESDLEYSELVGSKIAVMTTFPCVGGFQLQLTEVDTGLLIHPEIFLSFA